MLEKDKKEQKRKEKEVARVEKIKLAIKTKAERIITLKVQAFDLSEQAMMFKRNLDKLNNAVQQTRVQIAQLNKEVKDFEGQV